MQISYKSKQQFLPCLLHYLFLSFSLLLPSLCALCKWVAFSSCGLHFYYLSKNDKIYGSLAIFLTPKTSAEKNEWPEEFKEKRRRKRREVQRPINHADEVRLQLLLQILCWTRQTQKKTALSQMRCIKVIKMKLARQETSCSSDWQPIWARFI